MTQKKISYRQPITNQLFQNQEFYLIQCQKFRDSNNIAGGGGCGLGRKLNLNSNQNSNSATNPRNRNRDASSFACQYNSNLKNLRNQSQCQQNQNLILQENLNLDLDMDKSIQQEIMKKIKNLINARLLVNIYDKSKFRLVIAHYHLGKAYFKAENYSMAIQHISLAIHMNQKLNEGNNDKDMKKTVLMRPYMVNMKAQALMMKRFYQQAMQLLKENIIFIKNLQDELLKNWFNKGNANSGPSGLSYFSQGISISHSGAMTINIPIQKQIQCRNKAKTLLAECYSKLGYFQKALKTVDQVIQEIKAQNNSGSQFALSFTSVQKAMILAAQNQFAEAIQSQQSAIKTLIDNNYPKPLQVVKMYEDLSEYFQKSGNPENSLFTMQKVRTLYQQIYSDQDKHVIRTRRKIAIALLKSQRLKQAVNQLMDILAIQQKIFGESSLPTARTLKLLGIVYRSLQTNNSKVYLNRAMKIFAKNGMNKQVIQIKGKMNVLNVLNNGRTLDIFPHSQQQI